MRNFFLLIFVTLAIDARAENPPHECLSQEGCQEEKTLSHDIGRGVILTLPEGWTYFSYPPAPIPQMANLNLREVRAFKGGVAIAITPFLNIDKREIDEDWVRGMLAKGSVPNVFLSKESAFNFVSMSREDLVGGYASFTAKNEGERPFAVLPSRTYSKVTTFLISYRFVIFTVSVVSEQPLDDNYPQALNAILKISSEPT